ncbi:CLUMA_CG009910, isoform A [Clunio marinus]|uniref:CLUMA_CG009910, isoform A n=1 Tax=Clunio marinus TaxID=568069 RepID=A0A1J1IAK7_9DIPT|nr:CLUMA_CG009910, isoform A [Clunio marinus]
MEIPEETCTLNTVKSVALKKSVELLLLSIEEKGNQNSGHTESLILEELLSLSDLLGEVVERALDLVDNNTTIKLFRSQQTGREIFELHGERIYHFFPKLPYCVCRSFHSQVIRGEEYCCKHYLAARIAKALNKVEIIEKPHIEFPVNFVENTEIQLSENGLKYIAEDAKCFQSTAYIKKDFFKNFHFRPPSNLEVISFGVNLLSFAELLTAFIDNNLSNMNIVYYHEKNCILFNCTQIDSNDGNEDNEDGEECGEIITEYFIQTKHSVEPVDFTVQSPSLLNSIILDAYEFQEILNDFDRTIDALEIKINQHKMTLKTVGTLQCTATSNFPANSEVFNKFECYEPSKFCYKFTYFKVMLKGLAVSSKISLTTHVDGMVKVQLLTKSDEDQDTAAYIEYFMLPNLPDEDFDNENDEII